MCVNISVYELCILQDIDLVFVFFMEGYFGSQEDCQQILFVWLLGWNLLQVWNKFQDEVGGYLCVGDFGVCLIELKGEGFDWFQVVLVLFSVKVESWKVVLLYYLFGSEENSLWVVLIQQCILEIYVVLFKEDVDCFGVNDGVIFGFQFKGQVLCLLLCIDE